MFEYMKSSSFTYQLKIHQFGTTVLDAQVSKLYNKKVDGMPVEKGVAFPVCISVNEVVCNMSPLASDEMVSPLKVEAN